MFEQTGGMFPELITRSDLNVFLPPIGGQTVYVFGPSEYLRDPSKVCTVRVHDECNGSDVFGSDICTCRPYLAHGVEVRSIASTALLGAAWCQSRCGLGSIYLTICCGDGEQECVRTAQNGGVGVIVYFRKEGRSLGEVTKFLVYNARKRQEGGDRAETYFHRSVACMFLPSACTPTVANPCREPQNVATVKNRASPPRPWCAASLFAFID